MKRRGFSLIELLIALLILGIVIVALSTIFFYGFNSANRTQHEAVATQIAHEQMELIRCKKFEDLPFINPTFSSELLSQLEFYLLT